MNWGYRDMGLLNYIKSHSLDAASGDAARKKPRGLLERAIRVLQGGNNFDAACVALGSRHAAILVNRSGIFRVTHAYSLDAATLAAAVSTATWWNGIMGGDDVRTFDRAGAAESVPSADSGMHTLAGCYQLFSAQLRDRIDSMMAVRVSPVAMFISITADGEKPCVANKDSVLHAMAAFAADTFVAKSGALAIDNAAVEHFGQALEMSDAVLCRLDVSRAVNECLLAIDGKDATGGVMCDVREALYEELLQMMRRSFPPPAYCADNKDGMIKMVLFANEEFDQDLALFHIQAHLESILGAESEDVDLMDALRASSTNEITAFIG